MEKLKKFVYFVDNKYQHAYLSYDHLQYNEESQKLMLKHYASKGYLDNFLRYAESREIDLSFEDNFLIKCAAGHSRFLILEYLVNKGLDVTCCNNYAIKLASSWNLASNLKYLIENGADVNSNDYEPLKYAVTSQNVKCIQILIESCANVNFGNGEIFNYMIYPKYKIGSFDNPYDNNDSKFFSILKLLFDNGANIENYGDRILKDCVHNGNDKAVQLLVDCGIDLNDLTEDILMDIIRDKHYTTIRILIENGVSFDFINHRNIDPPETNLSKIYDLLKNDVDSEKLIYLLAEKQINKLY